MTGASRPGRGGSRSLAELDPKGDLGRVRAVFKVVWAGTAEQSWRLAGPMRGFWEKGAPLNKGLGGWLSRTGASHFQWIKNFNMEGRRELTGQLRA